MTPDPPNSPLDDAPAASGPTEPIKFEPTAAPEPTAPAAPSSLPPASVPAVPVAAAQADKVEPSQPTPAPAPGQVEAAQEVVERGDAEPDSDRLGTAAKVGLADAATAGAAVAGAAVTAVASAVTSVEEDTEKSDEKSATDVVADAGAAVADTASAVAETVAMAAGAATSAAGDAAQAATDTVKKAAGAAAPLAARIKGGDAAGGPAAQPHVPSVPAEGETGGENLVPAPDAAKPAPLPTSPQGISIPKSAELDSELEAAISAGLGDDALSQQMNAAAETPAEGEEASPPLAVGMEENIEPGSKLMGKVDSKTDTDLFVNLEKSRLQGIIPRTDYPDGKGPPVGFAGAFFVDRVDADAGLIHLSSPRGRRKVTGDWDSVTVGQTVQCSVTGTNKGGLQVQVGQLRGFMPASQIDIGFVSDMGQFVGQRFDARVIEVKPEKKNLVLSRAAVLKEARKDMEKELWDTLKPGDVRDGIVRAMKPYGAFVDIGGLDGFLHIGEISHNRIGHPSDVLNDGQKIQVKILKVDPGSRKVGLGMKQLTKDPWQQLEESYPVGSTLKGRVTRCTDFGAFVEIEQGVEGLIHISELDHKRVSRVSDIVRVNEEVETKVLTVEPNRKRISLSLKALKDKPQMSSPRGGRGKKKEDEEPDLPAYERQRKGPLKGGTGNKNRGGLFGDPGDFNA